MEDQVVSFEVAKLAREKGFNLIYSCDKGYQPYTEALLEGDLWSFVKKIDSDKHICAPTQTMLRRWLSETHKIIISIDPHFHRHEDEDEDEYMDLDYYAFDIYKQRLLVEHSFDDPCDTYEEALDAALNESLQLI